MNAYYCNDFESNLEPEHKKAFQEFVDNIEKNVLPELKKSALFVSITPSSSEKVDPRFAAELGLAVLLDKTIIALTKPGVKLPEKYVKIVDQNFEFNGSEPADFKEAVQAIYEKSQEAQTENDYYAKVAFAVHLGYCIMLDKPIVTVIVPGAKLSKKFTSIIDRFIEYNKDRNSLKQTIESEVEEIFREKEQDNV